MKTHDFVEDILEHIENNVCYLAIMPNDDGFDIEVEVNSGTIGGNYATNTDSLPKARQIADEIERELVRHGVEVVPTRDEWEDYLAD
jgi:hypothetical protein